MLDRTQLDQDQELHLELEQEQELDQDQELHLELEQELDQDQELHLELHQDLDHKHRKTEGLKSTTKSPGNQCVCITSSRWYLLNTIGAHNEGAALAGYWTTDPARADLFTR